MPLHLTWSWILIRLAVAVFAGGMLGWNRREHAHAAGMRTTLLVCLTAAVAMVMVNLLIDQRGKASDSFVQLDMMRLPLGILTGVGFIGAGAILRRGSAVQGVTTAATLWFATILGLCFGAGLIGLGLLAFAFGWIALTGLKRLEERVPQDRRGMLTVIAERAALNDAALRVMIVAQGFSIQSWAVRYDGAEMTSRCGVKWRGLESDEVTPPLVQKLAEMPGMRRVKWRC